MKKAIIAAALAMTVCLNHVSPVLAAGTVFSDVPESHWAYASIQKAVEKGIAAGYEDGTFRPSEAMTNGHFTTFLARAFYPDLYVLFYQPNTEWVPWWTGGISSCSAVGILGGTKLGEGDTGSTTALTPLANSVIERYDMAQLMYNLLVDKEVPLPSAAEQKAAQARISDWPQVPARYQTAVAVCYAMGLLTGFEDGAFRGASGMTRDQGCTVIDRLAGALERGTSVNPPDSGQTGDQQTGKTASMQSAVVELVNTERAKQGLSALGASDKLNAVAQLRAQELITQFSHTRPNGSSCVTALNEAGVSYRAAGENIAAGYATPASVMDGWMNSEGHRANILSSRYGKIGVGYVVDDSGYVYWCQIFTN